MVRLRSYTDTLTFHLQQIYTRIDSGTATLALAACLLGSTTIYWWGFVQPYPLLELFVRPLLDLRKLSLDNPDAPNRLIIAFLGLGALYWLSWRAAQRASGWAAWVLVLGGSALFAYQLIWIYPFDAADIFDNIMHGRILGVHGANPFLQPPNAFPDDPFLRYVAWKKSASAYGPGWELLAAFTARMAGDTIVRNVIAFKLLSGAFLIAAIGIVAAILRQKAPERALAGVVLLAWNPVILYETFGNGHNDMAMVVWILAAVWAVTNQRYTLAVLALVVGMLVKYIPLLMLPVVGLLALRDLPDWRSRTRFVLLAAGASLLLVVAAYWPFWEGTAILTIERRTRMFTASLPAMIHAQLGGYLGSALAGMWISIVAAGLTALFALWQAIRALRNRSWLAFPEAAFMILMFYLLLTCLWFQQWYALWPLGLAAILPPGHAARLAALFGYAALSKQLIFEPLWLWYKPLPPKSWRELRLGAAVLAVPWLYVLLVGWQTFRARNQSPLSTLNTNIDHET